MIKKLLRSANLFLKKVSRKKSFLSLVFIFVGIASTVWFLIRVIPKPQRATYPCMRATAPIMSGFVIYLLTLFGAIAGYFKSKELFKKANFKLAAVFAIIAIVCSAIFLVEKSTQLSGRDKAEWKITPNQPLGTAKGIFPGRVAWIHDPAVANWDGKTGDWWDENVTSQAEANKMMQQSLLTLTGEKSEKEAWTALFKFFNAKQKRASLKYEANQKVAVKINTNNTYAHKNSEEINASPQMVLALLKSLVNEAGVPQKNITVFDASRFITDNIFEKCHAAFPEVIFVDNVGGDGRVKSTYVDNALPYSVDNGKLATGLATCAVEADYLINMALLKGHVGQGVTLCAKNYYGVTSIFNDWRLNAHNNFDQDREGKAKYMTFVDFLAHKDLGEKTMLFLIDGIYGAKAVNGAPGPKWQMAPFNNNWPGTLLASQDPVAIDAVGFDMLYSEWPDLVDIKFGDQYLIEAAMANNPPSGAKYDPQRNNQKTPSLGVMEHWNNSKDMKYSRNLGKKEGIELIRKDI